MLVSVIIPTYKPQDYLWQCLDSLCSQTLDKKDFEIILVLNGCNNPYNDEIRNYIASHPNINWKYIQTDQSGVSNARNIALDNVKGKYITFIDDDDFISCNYLTSLLAVADEETIALACPCAFNDGDQTQIDYRITREYDELSKNGKQKAFNARKFFSGPWMKLIPFSYVSKRRFDCRFKVGEDGLFMFLISDKYKYVDFADKSALYYRRYRKNSAITTKRSRIEIIKNELKLLKSMLGIYIPNFWRYNFYFSLTTFLSTINGMRH